MTTAFRNVVLGAKRIWPLVPKVIGKSKGLSYSSITIGGAVSNAAVPYVLIFVSLFLVFPFTSVHAQNLDAIGQKNPLKISGGLNLNNVFYGAQGIESRRDPYSYFLTGNLSVDLYGWVVPVSFTHSNQTTAFQQPFNQYSINPTYKWVTAHIGYTSMTFSPYTLNGHIFKGVGVDLAPPGRFKFSAMYGRLQKEVEPDTLNNNAETAAFRRMGMGLKASYLHEGNSLDVILFHAKDQLNSINQFALPEELRPQENLVLSIAGGKTFFKKLLCQVEFSSSALTRDTRISEAAPQQKNAFSFAGPLYTQRSSSSYYNAFKSGMTYQGKSYTVGVTYERVEPEYRTLGAYYFNNDLENVTLNLTKALLKGKLNLAANGGVQRDNLDDSKISTMRRFVGSFNVGYAPSERLNLSGSYSSFNTYTNIRSQFVDINQLTPYDNLDTLNYTQLSQSSNVNVNYNLNGKEKYRQSINLNAAIQDVADQQGGVEQSSGSTFYNLNSSYNIDLVPRNLGVSVAFNFNQNKMEVLSTNTWGPTIGFRKSFFDKKVRATASTSLNNSYSNSALVSSVWSVRIGGNFSLKKSHHINASMVVLNRTNNRVNGSEKFTEFTGNLGYSYSF